MCSPCVRGDGGLRWYSQLENLDDYLSNVFLRSQIVVSIYCLLKPEDLINDGLELATADEAIHVAEAGRGMRLTMRYYGAQNALTQQQSLRRYLVR